MNETQPEKAEGAFTRWMKRFARQPHEEVSKHRSVNRYGASRQMTKQPHSAVRKRNRRRNKVARASRKANARKR